MELIYNHLTQIILAVIALLAGVAITINIRKKAKNNSNKVTQKGNTVGGDMAGRDLKKK